MSKITTRYLIRNGFKFYHANTMRKEVHDYWYFHISVGWDQPSGQMFIEQVLFKNDSETEPRELMPVNKSIYEKSRLQDLYYLITDENLNYE